MGNSRKDTWIMTNGDTGVTVLHDRGSYWRRFIVMHDADYVPLRGEKGLDAARKGINLPEHEEPFFLHSSGYVVVKPIVPSVANGRNLLTDVQIVNIHLRHVDKVYAGIKE